MSEGTDVPPSGQPAFSLKELWVVDDDQCKIQASLKKDLDKIDINDSCIQNAIRYKMNDDPSMAVQELGALQDYRLRMPFEQLIMNLPRKELEEQSEETLVANIVAPILSTFLNHVDDDIHTHLKQGFKADKPDFKVMIGNKETSFGEVTGHCQRGDKAKNDWDLWRLVRFGKSVLDEGAPMVSLVQIIYDEGTLYQHFVRIRGIMVLAEGAIKWLENNQ
ncbi:hypothetical protein BGZ54_003112 [Gamsiella multidivaricata]|nr:hypothetical protein BGZ54_003112 [Gamsiella multidivaricata]